MIRTSTMIVRFEPTRSNSRCCKNRSSFTCVDIGISPISSRNSVPPSACSKRPCRRVVAPVNDPFSCPKSSLSSSVSDSAAQCSRTNGRSARALFSWISRATSSFPVPDSPEINTVAREVAT
jgi:hypothetical protein